MGSMVVEIFITFRSMISVALLYTGNMGRAGPFGLPSIAKLVMYSCKAIATRSLKTELLGPLKNV